MEIFVTAGVLVLNFSAQLLRGHTYACFICVTQTFQLINNI